MRGEPTAGPASGQTAAVHAARHLQILAAEGGRVAALPADALEARGPNVPGGDLEGGVCEGG